MSEFTSFGVVSACGSSISGANILVPFTRLPPPFDVFQKLVFDIQSQPRKFLRNHFRALQLRRLDKRRSWSGG